MAYETAADVAPQEGKQRLLMRMIAEQEVDFCLMGGSRYGGKSELLSMMPLLFAGDPYYRGIFFRRSYDEIMGANGLWEKAENQYEFFNAHSNKSDKHWAFPSGAKQLYRHMFNDDDHKSHRGKGYSLIGFDEIDQFTPEQVQFLMTCLRSEANMNSFMVGTLNPHPDSWCLPLVEWYLKDDGFPDPDKVGVVRWYVVKDGDFIFGDSEEWFQEHHRDCLYVKDVNTGEELYSPPKRFTFIFFNIFDNPIGLGMNPQYVAELNNLPDHDRDTQLYGNWYARVEGVNYFKREYLKQVGVIPEGSLHVRAYDLAATERSQVDKDPDPTVCIKMSKSPNGHYYLSGDYYEDFYDEVEDCYGRACVSVGNRETLMLKQAEHDGDQCYIVCPQDPASAGKQVFYEMSKKFAGEGYIFKKDPVAVTQKKLEKFIPFATAAENGLVFIVPHTFHPKTLNFIMKELELFDGERSKRGKHDDFADAVASAYNYLSKSNHQVNVDALSSALTGGKGHTTINKFTSLTNSMLR